MSSLIECNSQDPIHFLHMEIYFNYKLYTLKDRTTMNSYSLIGLKTVKAFKLMYSKNIGAMNSIIIKQSFTFFKSKCWCKKLKLSSLRL